MRAQAVGGLIVGLFITSSALGANPARIISAKAVEDGTQFVLKLDAVPDGLVRELYACYGTADGGSSTDGWEHVELVCDLDADQTLTTQTVSSAFCAATPCLRFITVFPSEGTSLVYLQSGLAAQWDGIENAGRGQHSADTKTWTDLVGGWNAVSADGTHWAADGYAFAYGQNRAFSVAAKDGVSFQNALGPQWTVEVFIKPAAGYYRQYSGIVGSHGNGSGIVFGQNDGSKFALCSQSWSSPPAFANALLPQGECHHLALAADDATSNARVYIDGVEQASYSIPAGKAQQNNTEFFIGMAFNSWQNRSFDGTIYAVRAYTNALTAAQIKANCGIDDIRFAVGSAGLASALFSYDRVLSLAVKSVATAQDGSVESFTLALVGDFAEAGTIYAAYGASDGGAITDSWDFVEAVAPVAAGAKEITVPAPTGFGRAASCIRFFHSCAGGHLTSRDYVVDNLFAQWDGTDNAVDAAGNRVHLSKTADWADLSGNGWTAKTPVPDLWTDSSYRFTRSKTCAFVVSGTTLQPSMGESWTVEACVRPTTANQQSYAGIAGGHDGYNGFIFGQYNSGYWFGISGGTGFGLGPERLVAGEVHHVAYAADDASGTATLFFDGIADQTASLGSKGSKLTISSFRLGSAYDDSTARTFDGDIYAIRVYRKPLTPAEARRNFKVDMIRQGVERSHPVSDLYRLSKLVNLDVTTDYTLPYGTVDPEYGMHSDIGGRLPLECTASQFHTNSATLYECRGSVLSRAGEPGGVTNAATVRVFDTEGAGTWTLKWIWKLAGYSLTASANGLSGTRIEVDEPDYHDFYTPGAQVTLRAVSENDQLVFDHWEGDVPAGSAREATITFAMDGVKTLKANFRPAYWVYDAAQGTCFDGMNTLTAKVADGRVTVTGVQALTDPCVDLSAPFRTAEGDPLTLVAIGTSAFYRREPLVRVKLPDTLESVGDMAFYKCENLVSVEPLLPVSVTNLGSSAFCWDAQLTNSVDLGRTRPCALGAGGSQFSQCNLLGDVYLGAGVTNVPDSFAVGQTAGEMHRVVLVGARTIETYAFNNRPGIREVVMSPCIERIGSYAFWHDFSIRSVQPFFPDTLRGIGEQAFWSMPITNALVINSRRAVDWLGTASQFSMVSTIPSIELGRGVTDIPDWFDCKDGEGGALTNVTARGVLRSIGQEAFRAQNGLRDFRLNGYPVLHADAFKGVGGFQIRFSVPYASAEWDAYIADTSKVQPWDEVSGDNQAKFFDRFGAEAKTPVGQTLVTDRLPANQWVFRWNPLPSGSKVILR